MYDEYLAGYKGWDKIADAATIERLGSMRYAAAHVVILDGHLVGTWRRDFRKDTVEITLELFRELNASERKALSSEAERYAAFFGVTLV